jgi:hypothetical protein
MGVSVTGWAEARQEAGSRPRREAGFVSAVCQKGGLYWKRGLEALGAVQLQGVEWSRSKGRGRSGRAWFRQAASCQPRCKAWVRIKLERF